jgi:hypothetical protein
MRQVAIEPFSDQFLANFLDDASPAAIAELLTLILLSTAPKWR